MAPSSSRQQQRLKVKNEKGKFDIVLNEAKLFNAEAKDKRRQNSKGFSSKTSQAHPSQAKTSKKQVTADNLKKNEKAKTVQMGHQRDINDDVLTRKKPPIARKKLPTNDASYLTKDQLSRILSSLSNHDQPAAPQGSMKSESQKTAVHQSLTVNSQTSTDLAQASAFKTSAGDAASPEQATLSDKNFQWKKDLDEQVALKQKLKARQNLLSKDDKFEEYNPWGRPGAGAPIRTQSGNVVADYKKMVQNEVQTVHADVLPLQTSDDRPKMKTTGQASNTHYVGTEVPAAMRSSFAVGAPGIVTYETNQSKAEGKKKWLQELEQQIKEKKEREAQEKLQQTLGESKHETWHQTPAPRLESSASATVPASSASTKQHFPLQTVEASVAPGISDRPGNVHARGHGLQSLGQLNQDELERKRIKTLEHQLAIKEQVEEKRRIKQEEKERRMKEEAEKERALGEERTRLQKQYQEELKIRQEKEEKATKRIKHLESGGHDVSGLRSRMEAEHNSVHQDTAVGQPSTRLSYVTEYPQSSPRIGQVGSELPKEDDIASSHQNNTSLESELKEISLNASLESQWIPSSPVSSRRNDSQAKSHSDSSPVPRKAATRQSNKTTRAQSEKGLRKKQPPKHQIKKRTSLENVTHGEVPPPLEDAFMVPYRRTSSATFLANLDTPTYSHQDTSMNTNKPTLKKPEQATQRKTTNIKKHNEGVKVSESARTGQGISTKTSSISKMADKRKVKPDKASMGDGKPVLHPVQLSPDPLPTARQEMILEQLAALRQGLMMKERELHYGAL